MLKVNLKQGIASNLSGPLTAYIRNVVGRDPGEFERDLAALEQLRRDVLDAPPVTSGGAVDPKVTERYIRYWCELQALMRRFPIGAAPAGSIQIQFSWKSFNTGIGGISANPNANIPFTSTNIKFEEASVLFNLALANAQAAAASAGQGTSAGWTTACKLYLRAAGIFHYIGEVYAPELYTPVVTDMSKVALDGLEATFIAEAQECVVRKAMQEGTVKPAILLRLAMAASTLYQGAKAKCMAAPQIFERHWAANLHGKAVLFHLQALRMKALDTHDAKRYGEEIFWMREIESALAGHAQQSRAEGLDQAMPGDAAAGIAEVGGWLNTNMPRALNDNRIIYCEPIPTRDRVQGGGELGIAIVAQLDSTTEFPGSDDLQYGASLFAGLPDLGMQAAVGAYMRTRDAFFDAHVNAARSAREDVAKQLADTRMPSALDAAEMPVRLPDTLLKQAAEFRQAGGVAQMQNSVEDFRKRCDGCKVLLDTAMVQLGEVESVSIAAQSGEDTPVVQFFRSSGASQRKIDNAREEIRKQQNMLELSMKADGKTEKLLDDALPKLLLLGESDEELARAVPQASVHAIRSGPIGPIIQELRGIVDTLLVSDHQLHDLLVRMDEIRAQDQMPVLLPRSENPQGDVDAAMRNFEQLIRDPMQSILETLPPLFTTLHAQNAQFVGILQSRSDHAAREASLAEFTAAFNAFKDFQKRIRLGYEHYQEFEEKCRLAAYEAEKLCKPILERNARWQQEREQQERAGRMTQGIPAYGAPAGGSPYGAAAPAGGSPYGAAAPYGAAPASPYGAAAQMYGAVPTTGGSPYGGSPYGAAPVAPAAAPYGGYSPSAAAPSSATPYGSSQYGAMGSPYGAAASPAAPLSQRIGNTSPPTATVNPVNPYGAPAANPYGGAAAYGAAPAPAPAPAAPYQPYGAAPQQPQGAAWGQYGQQPPAAPQQQPPYGGGYQPYGGYQQK